MESKFKEVASTENGILARLWRRIVFDNNLQNALPFLIQRYSKKGTRNTSTIVSLITNSELTWKAFVFLVFEILTVKELELTLELTKNDEVYKVSIKLTKDDVKYPGKKLAELRNKVVDILGLDESTIVKDYKKRGGGKSVNTINNHLKKSSITWKVLVFLLFEVFEITELNVIIKIRWINDEISLHNVKVRR